MQHGFARNVQWTSEVSSDGTSAIFRLSSASLDAPTLAEFSEQSFELELTVSVQDDTLTQALTVKNVGGASFSFTTALHTYFGVSEAARATVAGLQGTRYLDSLDGRVEKCDDADAVNFAGEVDRIYLNVPRELQVVDGAAGRAVSVTISPSLGDVIVWNPWVEKSQRMPDFGDDEFERMLCLEVAQVRPPVQLDPSATWTGTQSLRAVAR